MAEVTRVVQVPPSRVFAVLSDGWSYPLWVVGASHMRDVDDGWPQIGTRIHHAVGVWPLLVNDDSEVLDMVPDRRLELAVRVWPSGSAQVTITLEPVPDGTRITMEEHARSGPAALLPGLVQDAMLTPRNRESLSRLEDLATRRQY